MSKRMALMPPELFSAYYQQKPEIRLEDELSKLLDREKLPDDMKVKLLSQLVARYQKTMHEPSEPVRVSVVDKEPEKNLMTDFGCNRKSYPECDDDRYHSVRTSIPK
ncbi:hypothetical protein AVEN_94784-1 [Araneus ventricosus]|uniref:Uncharacterized protein n=1 Tax=Araneus ventricosus TaxID=182803 RepID=A0A4Y2CM69_ARAVE|nr:hypothetical protein AVEN_94784-1 [Araneus ventricosus]